MSYTGHNLGVLHVSFLKDSINNLSFQIIISDKMTENELGIEEGTRALTRNKDSLVGQEMTLEKAEKKETTTQEGEKREVNLYTARLHYDKDSDQTIQFFGTSVMDNQVAKDSIKLGDRVSIDKIVSKESGRTYYTFVLLSRTEKDIDALKEAQEQRDE